MLFQDSSWTAFESKDGEITGDYKIEQFTNDDGDKKKTIHIYAKTTLHASLNASDQFLRDANNYDLFLQNCQSSKKIKQIHSDKWVLYTTYRSFWPLPKGDCVQTMTFQRNNEKLTIYGEASPTLYDDKGMRRIEQYDIKYQFERIKNNQTELTITCAFTPIYTPPGWLIQLWFPGGPIGIVERLTESIENM